MLRNIFPDEPPGDQDAAAQAADDPGAFFAEFLPSNHQRQKAAAETAATAAKASAAGVSAAGKQANAPAATAAAALSAAAAQQQQQQQRDVAVDSDSDILPDLPSFSEIKAAATAWFADDADAADNSGGSSLPPGAAAAQQQQQQQSTSNGKTKPAAAGTAAVKAGSDTSSSIVEDSEGLLDRLLPSFCQEGGGLRQRAAGFRAGRRGAKSKPLRLKLAEQMLSKELLSAVQVVESEILSSQDALPAATLKFFLKAGRTMGQGWVSQNATRVFGFLTAYVAATCGVMHVVKAGAKWLAWRLPRLGKRVTGPAVSFTADVLLPTPFFGPCLATYVFVRLLCKPPKSAEEREAEEAAAAAAAEAGADAAAGGGSSGRPAKQQQQQVQQREVTQVTRSRSRELQLEFVVDNPPRSLRGGGSSGGQQWPARQPLARVGSLRGRLRNKAGRRVSGSGP